MAPERAAPIARGGEAAPTRVGRYELFDVFASGGMASVHLGRLQGSVGFARVVAVKRLHPHLSTRADVAAMLVDEARVAGRIRHLNVVPTLDVIAEEDEILVVMEYVHGLSLSALLNNASEQKARCPTPIALAIVRDALRGLHAAHEARDEEGRPLDIVHRDVSPQNIIVGTDGVGRVVDFGVAKARNRLQESTRDGDLKGKLSYMAPEQLRGESATRRVDIYGAGVVLWEAIAGTRLFSGDNEAATWMRVLNEKPAAPSTKARGVSPAVDALVLASLSKTPDERDPTALAMAERIEASGLVATADEVAAWVQSMAGAELGRRERMVAAIERTPVPSIPSSPPVVSGISRKPDSEHTASGVRSFSKRTWAGVIALALVTGVGVATLVFGVRSADADVIAPAAHESPVERMAAVEPPAPPPPSASTVAVAIPQAVPPQAEVIDLEPKPGPKVTQKLQAKRPKKNNCDPPFTVDEAGRKTYKEDCFPR